MDRRVEQAAAGYALRLSEAERTRYRMMAQRARETEAGLWERAGVVRGATIADIGCGPGATLVMLADVVGESGSVVGVEPDADARAAALAEIAERGLTNARVVDGDAAATPLEPGAYDVVMIRHVLFHVGQRAPSLVQHLATLLRPGGTLYAADTDATASRISPADADVLEAMARYRDFQQARGSNVDIGPHLGELFVAAGLEIAERAGIVNIIPAHMHSLGGPLVAAQAEMRAAGAATEADFERWDAARRRLASVPNAVMFIPLFIAVGRRPA